MKLIHLAESDLGWLYLRETSPGRYQWFEEAKPLELEASSTEEAFRIAYNRFKHHHFESLLVGYKFTLPERDEHGAPALFIDMARSLEAANGQYFDPETGHNFIVHQIPMRARELYKQLKLSGKTTGS